MVPPTWSPARSLAHRRGRTVRQITDLRPLSVVASRLELFDACRHALEREWGLSVFLCARRF
ncbi:protein of unknown function (plasmid) [Cupriavidus taiwanensis]|uniref:Uncharacterized protein n=1 Tax=Cupriavidus taiwanensis TaxID=164546 RepID=A0A375IMR4_9BURK|nr:protein of unknown function [Cupriavidus taiwanensis]